jgi:hypothetical protein
MQLNDTEESRDTVATMLKSTAPDPQANDAKKALEARNAERMAEVAKTRDDKRPVAPHFFELVRPDMHAGEGVRWRYRRGSYWEARSKGDWSGCRDIFGLQDAAN